MLRLQNSDWLARHFLDMISQIYRESSQDDGFLDDRTTRVAAGVGQLSVRARVAKSVVCRQLEMA